jgi:hypothetical protein
VAFTRFSYRERKNKTKSEGSNIDMQEKHTYVIFCCTVDAGQQKLIITLNVTKYCTSLLKLPRKLILN